MLKPLSNLPVTEIENRVARITIATRNTMQSGGHKLDRWTIAWDTPRRWENPLMGWVSS